jgi:hypothetical protein
MLSPTQAHPTTAQEVNVDADIRNKRAHTPHVPTDVTKTHELSGDCRDITRRSPGSCGEQTQINAATRAKRKKEVRDATVVAYANELQHRISMVQCAPDFIPVELAGSRYRCVQDIHEHACILTRTHTFTYARPLSHTYGCNAGRLTIIVHTDTIIVDQSICCCGCQETTADEL